MKNSNKDVQRSFDSNFDSAFKHPTAPDGWGSLPGKPPGPKPNKVAHAKKDDTTKRSRKRHLKERQQTQDAAIKYRILKGV